MFMDFLTQRANIFKIKRNMENRTNKAQTATEREPEFVDIPCRISKNRVFLMPEIELQDGYVLEVQGKRYEVIKGTEHVSSIDQIALHHRTYNVKEVKL